MRVVVDGQMNVAELLVRSTAHNYTLDRGAEVFPVSEKRDSDQGIATADTVKSGIGPGNGAVLAIL